MPYLIQNPEASDPEIHELRFGLNTIGREINNSIIVLHKSLSRHHAQLVLTDERVLLKDLNSLNHTFVNEIQIEQCELKEGDSIRCGSVVFKFVQTLNNETPVEFQDDEGSDLSDEGSDLSIVRRFSPNETRVVIQDLLDERHSGHQGSALRLRQKDTDQRAVDKLKILLEVSKQLSSPEEPDRLLVKILDLLFEIMNVDRAVILLVQEETGELEQKAVKFRPGISSNEQFYSTTITNLVYQNGDAVLIADAASDRRFHEANSILVQEIHASMCVPLKPREEVIGVLYADNLSRANVYSQEDLEFITGLGNQAAIAIENTHLYNKIQTEAVMRTKLERFFPQAVSRKLKEEGNLEIVDTEVTALFADISRFTQLSSMMEPRQVIEMLNDYFRVMVEEIVFPYEGTLEKYIGDALLAVWGAPYRRDDDACRAVQAAIAMQQAVCHLNEQWIEKRDLQIQIHIGLNTGMVAAGNIGSQKLIQYATIGDTVNVASRICSTAQAGEILISQTTLNRLGESYPIEAPTSDSVDTVSRWQVKIANAETKSDRWLSVEQIPPAYVKGKDEPIQLYRVLWDSYKA
ncbi:MAG TPA: adenylate/guanylate cyclase domain-containing protein [Chroococcales cyanobacterium]